MDGGGEAAQLERGRSATKMMGGQAHGSPSTENKKGWFRRRMGRIEAETWAENDELNQSASKKWPAGGK